MKAKYLIYELTSKKYFRAQYLDEMFTLDIMDAKHFDSELGAIMFINGVLRNPKLNLSSCYFSVIAVY